MYKEMKILKNLYPTQRSYKKGAIKPPNSPFALWIEPTNVCNLRCIMCPNSLRKQKKSGYMDMSTYKKIIDEAKGFIAYIVLCVSGEPLLHRNLPQMIKYAQNANIRTTLSTNASLLTPQLSREILEAGLDAIYFSFDGCSAEVYEKVRVGSNFNKTLMNIVEFLKIKKELKKKTVAELQILIMDKEGKRDYEKNIAAFKEKFRDLPLNLIQTRQPSTWGSTLSSTDKYEFKELGENYSPCSYLWCSMHILWDGTAVACTSDFFADNALGKFPNQSLKEIWNGEKYQQFRKAMLEKKYDDYFKTCKDCDSLWSEDIAGMPPGIRGVLALSLCSVIGFDKLKYLKKIAGKLNSDFAIKSVEDSR
jgi:radical SAM protein with 4Fe4S-binding SPASM domain